MGRNGSRFNKAEKKTELKSEKFNQKNLKKKDLSRKLKFEEKVADLDPISEKY